MLSGEVECDALYLIAGHKGQPEKVREACCRRLKGTRGRGTLATEKPPIFGMIQRSGEVRIWMLENVQQATIKPIILSSIAAGTLIFTDEYNTPIGLNNGVFSIKPSIIQRVNMRVTKRTMDFVKYIPTQWKVFGRYYAPGSDRIAAFRKISYRYI
jgi:transposase-like protein